MMPLWLSVYGYMWLYIGVYRWGERDARLMERVEKMLLKWRGTARRRLLGG
jgi:hypothetical protein